MLVNILLKESKAVSREEFTVMFGAIQNMQNQMTAMKRDLVEERTEANELLVKRLKLDKKPLFKKKAHEKQFEFNEEVRSKLNEASSGANATPPCSGEGEESPARR